jgi:hypothetical protein
MRSDPTLALAVDVGLRTHCKAKTRSSYGTGARDYLRFCGKRGLRPWPVDVVNYCGWLHTLLTHTQIQSMGTYTSGVRDASLLEGHPWHMTGHDYVYRTMRFLKHKYPTESKGQKVPITVGVIHKILPLLQHWPDMARMSPEDQVFALATVLGVAGFLRGGEFLTSRSSNRPTLMASDVFVRKIGDFFAVVLAIRQPKTEQWRRNVSVPCFQNPSDDAYCPVRLWEEYSVRCPGFKKSGPALLLYGRALERDYMVRRTTALMVAAGISFVDLRGDPMDVRAASWRSGATCSAVGSGVSAPNIMSLGRWRSNAYLNYLLQAAPDLQGSANSIWANTSLRMAPSSSSGLRVAEFDVGGFFAPHMATSLNTSLARLAIDVNNPPSE